MQATSLPTSKRAGFKSKTASSDADRVSPQEPLSVDEALRSVSQQEADASNQQEFVEIPLQIRTMLEEAGVEGAMGWLGVPASPPAEDSDEDYGDDWVEPIELGVSVLASPYCFCNAGAHDAPRPAYGILSETSFSHCRSQ